MPSDSREPEPDSPPDSQPDRQPDRQPRPARPPSFEGFRAGQRATTIPVQFFTELLEEIDDPDELRVTLYALYVIPRPGRPQMMRVSALAAEPPLVRSFAGLDDGRDEGAGRAGRVDRAIRRAVALASMRGTLLTLPIEGDDLVFVNNEAGRRLRARIASGIEPPPEGTRVVRRSAVRPEGVVAVYEAEIGMLSPSVAAALTEAEATYPVEWIADALREAARQNKRSWAYAEAILRRWQAEGRGDEATEGHPGRRGRDPYEHLYRRD